MLGEVKTTSALVFDTGIYLVVVGVVATLIETLVGARADSDDSIDDVGVGVGA